MNPPPPHHQAIGHHAPMNWSTGLFDCFSDFQTCCLSCWCPCVTFGRIAEIVDGGSTSCGASGALYALIQCVVGCGWLYSCFYRSKMRKQYNIQGSQISDCFTHCCCEPCSLTQEYRELQHRGFDMIIGWHGNASMGVAMPVTATAPTVEHDMKR